MIRGAGNSRHEAADSTDFFPTPAWGTRALIEHVFKPLGPYDPNDEVWESACGALDMAGPLNEYYKDVYASDIEPRGDPYGHFGDHANFLTSSTEGIDWKDWIITNPPFNLFLPFFHQAIDLSKKGTALLMPLTVIEVLGRYEKIYKPYVGRYCVAPFVERLPIVKNTVRKDATTARAYAWLVVVHSGELPPLLHIPPCRKQLERDSDYEAAQ